VSGSGGCLIDSCECHLSLAPKSKDVSNLLLAMTSPDHRRSLLHHPVSVWLVASRHGQGNIRAGTHSTQNIGRLETGVQDQTLVFSLRMGTPYQTSDLCREAVP
jgi:hypothetical protein